MSGGKIALAGLLVTGMEHEQSIHVNGFHTNLLKIRRRDNTKYFKGHTYIITTQPCLYIVVFLWACVWLCLCISLYIYIYVYTSIHIHLWHLMNVYLPIMEFFCTSDRRQVHYISTLKLYIIYIICISTHKLYICHKMIDNSSQAWHTKSAFAVTMSAETLGPTANQVAVHITAVEPAVGTVGSLLGGHSQVLGVENNCLVIYWPELLLEFYV